MRNLTKQYGRIACAGERNPVVKNNGILRSWEERAGDHADKNLATELTPTPEAPASTEWM